MASATAPQNLVSGGSSGISSMLKSAAAAANRNQAYNDSLAAYEWSNSQQTVDDYNKYTEYLATQSGKTPDPSKQLTYTKAITSAFKSYTSNEIQRSAIDILQGEGTLSDKQQTVKGLYEQAIANGDQNLAVNLQQQYDNIDVEMQKQQEAKIASDQALASKMAAHNVATTTQLAQVLLKGSGNNSWDPGSGVLPNNGQLAELYKDYGPEAFNKVHKTDSGVEYNLWDVAASNMSQAQDALLAAANTTESPSEANSLYNQAMGISDGSTKTKIGGMSLTVDDLNNARDAVRNGQNYFTDTTHVETHTDPGTGKSITATVHSITKSDITDLIWARDQQGNLRLVTTYANPVNNPLNQQVVNPNYGKVGSNGKTDNSKTIKQGNLVKAQLEKAGYNVISDNSKDNGRITVQQTARNDGSALPAGINPGDTFDVYLDSSGNVRTVSGQNQQDQSDIYQINLQDGDANYGKIQKIDPFMDTALGDPNIPNDVAAPSVLLGISNADKNTANTTSLLLGLPNGVSLLQGGPSGAFIDNITQNQTIKDTNTAKLQAASQAAIAASSASAAALQPALGANALNSLPGDARLTVAPPKPQPKVVVAPAAPQPKLTVAKPQLGGQLSVQGNNGGFNLQGGGL